LSLSGKLSELLVDLSSQMFDLSKPERLRTLLEDRQSKRQDKQLVSFVLVEQWLGNARPGKAVHT